MPLISIRVRDRERAVSELGAFLDDPFFLSLWLYNNYNTESLTERVFCV
jgi:hypothetical protein